MLLLTYFHLFNIRLNNSLRIKRIVDLSVDESVFKLCVIIGISYTIVLMVMV